MNAVALDPTLVTALKPFSPQIRKLALATVNRFIAAVNSGDETAADAVDNEIFQARGSYGKALDAILSIANGKCTLTIPKIDSLIEGAKVSASSQFVMVSTTFGYAIYATSATGDITDTREGATVFDTQTSDPAKLAAELTQTCGYLFQAVAA